MTEHTHLQTVMDETHTAEPPCHPHRIEEDVCRKLMSQPGFQFSSLVVHRLPGGVCIEGILEADDANPDVSTIARSVSGVDEVLNHLVIRPSHLPSKG